MLTWIFALASQEDPAPGGGGVDFKKSRLKGFAQKKSGLKKIQRFGQFFSNFQRILTFKSLSKWKQTVKKREKGCNFFPGASRRPVAVTPMVLDNVTTTWVRSYIHDCRA